MNPDLCGDAAGCAAGTPSLSADPLRMDARALADGGMWIADDCVYAFVGRHGVHTVGFHGLQPVSRNSRMLDADGGALRLAWRRGDDAWRAVETGEFAWSPRTAAFTDTAAGACMRIEARGTDILLHLHNTGATDLKLRCTLPRDALVTSVQGERGWSAFRAPADPMNGTPGARDTDGARDATAVRFEARDRIRLQEWMRRTGPYAGDFLIPESVRRLIFARRCRSGTATAGDLRPEYKNADLLVYDAVTTVELLADGGTLDITDDAAAAEFTLVPQGHSVLHLHFASASAPPASASAPPASASAPPASSTHAACASECTTSAQSTSAQSTSAQTASVMVWGGDPACEHRMHVTGAHAGDVDAPESFPHIRAWMRMVPALYDSCIVRAHDVPRACPGAYYWIWAWDAMVAAQSALAWDEGRTAAATARFVNAHRDEDGCIPMRWTRDLLPLDNPGRGALEVLHLLLVRACLEAREDVQLLASAWPHYVRHFDAIRAISDERGLFPSHGFYPDLTRDFGRTGTTAVAMEAGLHYDFCCVLASLAERMGDARTGDCARAQAERIRAGFLPAYFDERRGLLRDTCDLQRSATAVHSHPLFALMFLRAPEGWDLIADVRDELAAGIARAHLGDHGFRTLPWDDPRAHGESVSDAWYPHWDRYAVELLHRSGRHGDVARWMRAVEHTIAHLGYCPEFLTMEGFDPADPLSWTRHGAASNLTGVTAWYELLQMLPPEAIDAG